MVKLRRETANPQCPGTTLTCDDHLPLIEGAATWFGSKWWTAAQYRKAATGQVR